jgi:hypothetical protein
VIAKFHIADCLLTLYTPPSIGTVVDDGWVYTTPTKAGVRAIAVFVKSR